jgi:ABC-type multidrug transport system permease subunit
MDDDLKQKLMPAFVVFNLTVGAYMLVRLIQSLSRPTLLSFGEYWWHLLIGAAIGLVTGGITFALTRKK